MLLLLVSLAVVASACGGDDENDAQVTSSVERPTGGDGSPELAGDPIRLGTVFHSLPGNTSLEDAETGMNAAVRAINESGGIGGRPLEIDICVHEAVDPNDAARCARQFAEDDDIVALVASASSVSESFNPILEEASLPSIGQSMYNASDFGSAMVFAADGGLMSGIAAAGPICLNELGGTSLSVLYADVGAAAQVIQILDGFVLKPFGTQLSAAVAFPITATDLAAPAAEIVADGADCVATVASADSSVQLVRALRQQGYAGSIFVPAIVLSAETIREQLDEDQLEGVVLVRSYDYASSLYEEFLADLTSESGRDAEDRVSDHTIRGWLSVQLFAAAARDLDTVDRASVLTAMERLDFDTEGLLAGSLDYSSRSPDPAVLGGSAPNLILPFGMGISVADGEPVSAFQDVFGGPDQ